MLTHQCAQPPVCIRMNKNDHVHMLNMLNIEKTQHALEGLGSAALAAAVAFPR